MLSAKFWWTNKKSENLLKIMIFFKSFPMAKFLTRTSLICYGLRAEPWDCLIIHAWLKNIPACDDSFVYVRPGRCPMYLLEPIGNFFSIYLCFLTLSLRNRTLPNFGKPKCLCRSWSRWCCTANWMCIWVQNPLCQVDSFILSMAMTDGHDKWQWKMSREKKIRLNIQSSSQVKRSPGLATRSW